MTRTTGPSNGGPKATRLRRIVGAGRALMRAETWRGAGRAFFSFASYRSLAKASFRTPHRSAITAAILTGILLTAGGAVAVDQVREGVQPGDQIAFYTTAYDRDGKVLYTNDPKIGAREFAAGNPYIADPATAHPRTYTPMQGWAVLGSLGNATFDPVQFLVGHEKGDVIETPFIQKPFRERDLEVIPRVIRDVKTEFEVSSQDLAKILENSTPLGADHFLYGDLLPATITKRAEDSATVVVDVTPGQIVRSDLFGFAFEVIRVGEGTVDLRAMLEPGDGFTTQRCPMVTELGLPIGKYVVERVDEDVVHLRHDTVRDIMSSSDVRFEFRLIDVNDWPEIERVYLYAKFVWIPDAVAWVKALLPGQPDVPDQST